MRAKGLRAITQCVNYSFSPPHPPAALLHSEVKRRGSESPERLRLTGTSGGDNTYTTVTAVYGASQPSSHVTYVDSFNPRTLCCYYGHYKTSNLQLVDGGHLAKASQLVVAEQRFQLRPILLLPTPQATLPTRGERNNLELPPPSLLAPSPAPVPPDHFPPSQDTATTSALLPAAAPSHTSSSLYTFPATSANKGCPWPCCFHHRHAQL